MSWSDIRQLAENLSAILNIRIAESEAVKIVAMIRAMEAVGIKIKEPKTIDKSPQEDMAIDLSIDRRHLYGLSLRGFKHADQILADIIHKYKINAHEDFIYNIITIRLFYSTYIKMEPYEQYFMHVALNTNFHFNKLRRKNAR